MACLALPTIPSEKTTVHDLVRACDRLRDLLPIVKKCTETGLTIQAGSEKKNSYVYFHFVISFASSLCFPALLR